ncbi:hypothetical protein [Alicyclobacillus dauci]|uniref:SMI1-KNR4 cell-wall n=1 Tax=Alicyclobacillus dauci TaxID=1475485 RepID=A0ABY6Z7G1_9BACL|nr:hypothetical protein [Alicyclobacillus dauci]WAH38843.1 hypothetical protein NZD86_10365 [Alicyclobacillus dauci]
MKHIQTQEDLKNLKSHLPRSYYQVIEAYFMELMEASYQPENDEDFEFILDSGHIVIIEATDNQESLQPLLTSWPEYAQLIQLDDGSEEMWKIVCLFDNDHIMSYFTIQGLHPTVDELAERHMESDY